MCGDTSDPIVGNKLLGQGPLVVRLGRVDSTHMIV